MNLLHSILVVVVALLAVFVEAATPGVRHWLGAQINLLPAIVVYAALQSNLPTLVTLTVLGGAAFDSLSANALGVTMLPLFGAGLVLHLQRELVLRDQVLAQLVLGGITSTLVPVVILLLLMSAGQKPLVGWGTIWQVLVMGVGGGLATPCFFALFDWLHRLLGYQPVVESSFRSDREIHRGRNY